jgi:hypothetical protein
MRLENIEIDGRDGNESSKIIKSLEALPSGTVKGISGYGFFKAEILKSGIIKMGDFDPTSSDEISVNVPKGATNISVSKRKTSFEYDGYKYEIYTE